MKPVPTADMVDVILRGEMCPICYWAYNPGLPVSCRPGNCALRTDDPAKAEALRRNRETYRRVEPLLRAAARNGIVAAHLSHLRAGNHPDPTSALIGMVGHLAEAHAQAVEIAVQRHAVPAWLIRPPDGANYAAAHAALYPNGRPDGEA